MKTRAISEGEIQNTKFLIKLLEGNVKLGNRPRKIFL